jgi:hypothetical protein
MHDVYLSIDQFEYLSIVDATNRFTYETQVDSNGINHHRLFSVPTNPIGPFSKDESSIIRTSTMSGIKMPVIGQYHDGHSRQAIVQRTNTSLTQQSLPMIESALKERSLVIVNEHLPKLNSHSTR